LQPRAFTLIEVMAVVVILALLAGTVVWSLTGDVRRVGVAEAADTIAHVDRTARIAAQRFEGGCRLRIDLDQQRARRLHTDAGGEVAAAHSVSLPRGHRIEQLVLAPDVGDAATGGAAARRVISGAIDIAYSPQGASPTYALRLGSPSGRQQWLVFAGLTGQMTVIDDERDVDNLFAMLAATRPDAD